MHNWLMRWIRSHPQDRRLTTKPALVPECAKKCLHPMRQQQGTMGVIFGHDSLIKHAPRLLFFTGPIGTLIRAFHRPTIRLLPLARQK